MEKKHQSKKQNTTDKFSQNSNFLCIKLIFLLNLYGYIKILRQKTNFPEVLEIFQGWANFPFIANFSDVVLLNNWYENLKKIKEKIKVFEKYFICSKITFNYKKAQ